MRFIDSWKEGTSGARPFRSNSYHKYYEKYTEVKVPDNSRKGYRIKRVYTGEYYVQSTGDTVWKCGKLLYTAEYTISLVLFCISGSVSTGGNHVWYTSLAQAAALFSMFLLLYTGLSYVAAPRRMTVGQYKSSSMALIGRARISACLIWISALAQVIYLCMPWHADRIQAAVSAALYAVLGLMLMHMSVREGKLEYIREPNPEADRVDGVEIE